MENPFDLDDKETRKPRRPLRLFGMTVCAAILLCTGFVAGVMSHDRVEQWAIHVIEHTMKKPLGSNVR